VGGRERTKGRGKGKSRPTDRRKLSTSHKKLVRSTTTKRRRGATRHERENREGSGKRAVRLLLHRLNQGAIVPEKSHTAGGMTRNFRLEVWRRRKFRRIKLGRNREGAESFQIAQEVPSGKSNRWVRSNTERNPLGQILSR